MKLAGAVKAALRGQGMATQGTDWRVMAVGLRRGVAWLGWAWRSRRGPVRRGRLRPGWAGHGGLGRSGKLRQVEARRGWRVQAVEARLVE